MFTEYPPLPLALIAGCNFAMTILCAFVYGDDAFEFSKKWRARLVLAAPVFGWLYIVVGLGFLVLRAGARIGDVAADAGLIKPSGGIVEREHGQLSEPSNDDGSISLAD